MAAIRSWWRCRFTIVMDPRPLPRQFSRVSGIGRHVGGHAILPLEPLEPRGSGQRNYARELFELHTLGRDAYLNDHYNRWRDVPGALSGAPRGYIDQDVYEAARAFTGWTVSDGSRVDSATTLPNTGQFAYVDAWHDGYQKRVLAQDFDPFQAAMADGHRVLDLVAAILRPRTSSVASLRSFCLGNAAACAGSRALPRSGSEM